MVHVCRDSSVVFFSYKFSFITDEGLQCVLYFLYFLYLAKVSCIVLYFDNLSFMSCNSRNLYLSFSVSSNKLSELVSKNKMTRSFIFVDIICLINIRSTTLSLLCLCVLTLPHGNAEPELFIPFLFYKHKPYKHTEAENVQHFKHTLSISAAWEKLTLISFFKQNICLKEGGVYSKQYSTVSNFSQR